MKFLILSENSNGAWPHLYFRSLGPYELRRRIELKGYDVDIIEWFTYWNHDELTNFICNYFKNEEHPVIALSTPFNTTDVHKIKNVLINVRNKFPYLKIIHGGTRTYDHSLAGIIDVFFLGRSMQMFDAWLENKNLDHYIVKTNPLVLINHNFDEKIDNPVIPILKDSDALSEKDVVGFEIGVGCKFNCTFCNYELRNSKITKLVNPNDLHNYFQTTYDRFGITNFFASDDTINETDTKLEIIAEAIQGLSFKPHITGYARLDMISARPAQIELLRKIQFQSLFFGIESFNTEASKLIRKKSGLVDNYETLKKIREVSPNTYTVGGLILGLNKDSETSIRHSLNRVVNENLLSSINLTPLFITKTNTISSTYCHSELDENPEKFNYKLEKVHSLHLNNELTPVHSWESDWTTFEKAAQLKDTLEKEYADKIQMLGHFEYAGFQALQVYDKNTQYGPLKRRQHLSSILGGQDLSYGKPLFEAVRAKKNYIKKKIQNQQISII